VRQGRGRVDVYITHKYEGPERSGGIVLGAVEKSYPLIHPNRVSLRVFGDNLGAIEDEERRFFYVGITRSKDALALVTRTLTESPYVSDIRRHTRLNSLSRADLPPAPSLDGARIEIRVFVAYDARDHL
jgi:DNA helicase-4